MDTNLGFKLGAAASQTDAVWDNSNPLEILQMIAECSAEVVSTHDSVGRCQYVSPNISELFGWKPSQLLGRRINGLIHPDDIRRITREWQLKRDSGACLKYRLLRPFDDYRWVESRARSTEKSGRTITVTRDIENEVQDIKQLRHDASHDALTNALNRRAFTEMLTAELYRNLRNSNSLSLIFMDVDRFKQINDTYGHAAGDAVLCDMARCIELHKRPYDVLGRWGGDEFVLLLPETGLTEAHQLVERMRIELSRELPGVGISFGLSTNNGSGDIAELLVTADAALYESKQLGGNRLVLQISPLASAEWGSQLRL